MVYNTGMRWVAFLRAINVGRNTMVKMEDLRRIFSDLGFTNVVTYINSGNVLFDSDNRNEGDLTVSITKAIEHALHKDIPVMLRTQETVRKVFAENPFKNVPNDKVNTTYVTFLSDTPTAEQKKIVKDLSNEHETFFISERELYSLIDKTYKGKLVFSNDFATKYLRLLGTARNLNTVQKVSNM